MKWKRNEKTKYGLGEGEPKNRSNILTNNFIIVNISDGCPNQYKCRQNLVNLLHHEKDYGIMASWNFFATSHGKGAYDGIGGTIKREAARESLRLV